MWKSVKKSHIVISKVCLVPLDATQPFNEYCQTQYYTSVFSDKCPCQSETNSSAQNTLASSILLVSDPSCNTKWGPGMFPYHLPFSFFSSKLITHIKIGGNFITDTWFLLTWSCLFSKTLRPWYRNQIKVSIYIVIYSSLQSTFMPFCIWLS